jgi:hypothetical protein
MTSPLVERLNGGRGRGRRVVLYETLDDIGGLGSVPDPELEALMVDDDSSGLGARVIVADDFDGAAIPGAIFFNNNDAISRGFFGAEPRQTNCEHVESYSFW